MRGGSVGGACGAARTFRNILLRSTSAFFSFITRMFSTARLKSRVAFLSLSPMVFESFSRFSLRAASSSVRAHVWILPSICAKKG